MCQKQSKQWKEWKKNKNNAHTITPTHKHYTTPAPRCTHTHTHKHTCRSGTESLALNGTTLSSTKAMQMHTCAHAHTYLQSGTEWDHFILYKSHANAHVRTHTQTSSSGTEWDHFILYKSRANTHMHTHTQTSSLALSGTTSSSATPLRCFSRDFCKQPQMVILDKKNWFLRCKRTYVPGEDQIMMTVMFSSCFTETRNHNDHN